MKLTRVIEGVWHIYAISDPDGTCPLMVALQTLEQKGDEQAIARILALLKLVAERPDSPSGLGEEKTKLLDSESRIMEFKAGQFRIPYFYEKNHIILCTHMFRKKSRRTPRSEIEKAIRIKQLYEEAKQTNALDWS